MINSPYDKYRKSVVQTSTPAQLVAMLYDGAIRFVRAGLDGLSKKDYEKANINLGKAQTIVSELMSTLDYTYEISKNLYSMYEYTNFLLVEANIRKDMTKAEEALGYLTELRETWLQASKIAAGQGPEPTSTESANG
ncbi:flagellar export chaperone FliS [Paenibacillus sp. 22594]|uniref:flagellar export chaperone FliS n=1 Tax=Paenibacillus sp. 22594 TaxID=3453947 RepID=UPI003F854D57